jgi:hypothetical protein
LVYRLFFFVDISETPLITKNTEYKNKLPLLMRGKKKKKKEKKKRQQGKRNPHPFFPKDVKKSAKMTFC